jgi:hypothetical protein
MRWLNPTSVTGSGWNALPPKRAIEKFVRPPRLEPVCEVHARERRISPEVGLAMGCLLAALLSRTSNKCWLSLAASIKFPPR